MSETDYHLHTDPTEVLERRIIAHVVDTALAIAGAVAIWWAKARGVLQLRLDDEGRALIDRVTLESGETVDRYLVEGSDALYRLSSSDPTLNLGGQTYVFRFAGAFVLGFIGLSLLLWVVLQAFTGSTPGKALTGIRTINKNGGRPGLVRSLLRWFSLGTIDGFPGSLMMVLLGAGAGVVDLVAAPVGFTVPLVGFLASLFTRGHRRIGDLLGGTFVVRRGAVGSPVDLDGSSVVPVPTPSEPTAPSHSGPARATERAAQRPVPTVERLTGEPTAVEPHAGSEPSRASTALRAEGSSKAAEEPKTAPLRSADDRRGLDTLDPSAPSASTRARPQPTAPQPGDLGLDPTEEFDSLAEADRPDFAPSDTAFPDAASSDVASSDTGLPDTALSDTASPDTGLPDTPSSDTALSTTIFETGAPEVSLAADADAAEESGRQGDESSRSSAGLGARSEQATDADKSRAAAEPETEWVYEPQWDEARQTYIVWDGRRREWLQYDEGAGQWVPISR